MRNLFFPLLLLAVVLTAIGSPASGEPDPPVTPQHSALWGESGESWDPVNGPLRDFTDVGYMGGDVPIPDWPVWANLTALGAIPDDHISDVAVLREAISNCPPYHAIFLPNGRYIIDEALDVTSDNIVIRGESRDRTILFFPKHMNEIQRTVRASDPFITFNGGTNRGIENLSLVFRDEQKATGYVRPDWPNQTDRHWFYSGERPISFGGGEQNSWMRNIYIRNSNHAIQIDGSATKHITVMNVVLDQFSGRTMLEDGTDGHMGIQVANQANHCLIHNILITGRWDHDICPMGARSNVFSRISGANIELDHHAMGNLGNLYTEIDTGIGGRGYGEAINSFNETYWGIKGIREASYLPANRECVFVGIHTSQPTDIGATWHHETLDPNALVPANLYLAQLAYRGKAAPADVELTLPPSEAPFRLLAVDDARVEGGTSAMNNYGFNSSMALKNGGGTTDRQGFMKFDLSGLGVTNAASVKLRIYLNNLANPPFGLQVLRVGDDSWSEAALTYSNQPAAGTVIAATNLSNGNTWVELDLTAHANGELAGDQTLSLKLRGGAPGANKDSFTSIQCEEGGNAAELVVHTDASTVAPPATPAGLTATPGDNLINLDWNDNTEDDFGSYNVYRSLDSGSTYVIWAMGLTTSDHEDCVVSNGTTYTYPVKAVDTAGTESLQGIEVAVHVLLDTDNDGMDDLWEDLHFPDPPGSDGTIDSDGDGDLDFFEYLYGSIPTDGNSKGFRFQASGGQNGPNPALGWEVKDGLALGRNYHLLCSTDLGVWFPVPEDHYSLASTRGSGRTRMELMIHHNYGHCAFFKLAQPRTFP